MSAPTSGRVEHIHLTDGEGRPMRSATEVRAVAGVGLEGDRYASGSGRYSDDPGAGRQLTLVEAEVLDSLRAEHDIDLAPGSTRRNLTTRGIRLNDLVGRRFTIGDVVCEAMRLCEPCQHLTDLIGQPVLEPLAHRGGLRADIVTGGVIRVGDEIRPA